MVVQNLQQGRYYTPGFENSGWIFDESPCVRIIVNVELAPESPRLYEVCAKCNPTNGTGLTFGEFKSIFHV